MASPSLPRSSKMARPTGPEHLTPAEYRELVGGKKSWHAQAKRSPREQRTNAAGEVFDSKDELRRGAELEREQALGLIRNLRRQVRFPLVIDGSPVLIRSERYPNGRRAGYRADFVYDRKTDSGWQAVVEERKTGWDDPASRLRRAVVEAIYGFRIILSAGKNAARRKR
jgi:hypothetical protein